MGRPSRALLSREAIARAALEVVDESGADGLTMRALADRLGVKAASLYNHVTGKDELLDALSELVNQEIDLTPLQAGGTGDGAGDGVGADWRDGLAAYARGYRAVFLNHPNTIALLARRRVEAEGQLRGYDTLLAALVRAGLTPADAAEAAAALDYLVLGSALETFTAGFTRAPGDYRPHYPALAASLEAASTRGGGPSGLDDRGFELALRLLLDGLAARTG
ncbi:MULTISPECIES: TetR/AcrR family transcriptional regulator C-terminal domain-containing protein [Streptacidiphilus]|uniref:TetR/AcrR family transcriptional regulator C-terminal domain-containing protein n=1 Tax=Streptacidiphilus cavernicola TaxID=3342716 RepID=A0ABV6UNH1_9ACTN|nr:TetR/AcrR family transcriptional regulator C-terminal domain-containing protein [Streptacidiphilus jeojiense]